MQGYSAGSRRFFDPLSRKTPSSRLRSSISLMRSVFAFGQFGSSFRNPVFQADVSLRLIILGMHSGLMLPQCLNAIRKVAGQFQKEFDFVRVKSVSMG